MDLLQDFLFHLEDDPHVNCSGYAEAMVLHLGPLRDLPDNQMLFS